MIRLKINGVGRTFDGDPEMPLLWYLRDVGTDRHQVRLRHGAVRSLHRASERQGGTRLHDADAGSGRRRDHHH